MRMLFAAVAALAFSLPAVAADTKVNLTGDNTKITFVGVKPDGKHDGGFKKLDGTATVTDGNLETLKIEVNIDTDSLYSDEPSGKLTGHLKSADFFGVKDNPKATFKSTKVEKGDKTYTITGDLTMLGVTKPITFEMKTEMERSMFYTAFTFTLKRKEFGMTFGGNTINDDVIVNVTVGQPLKKR